MKKKIVLVSGGMDSAVVLAKAVEEFGNENIIGLNLFYGQRHAGEILCAQSIASHYEVELMEVDVSAAFSNISSALLPHSGIEIDDNQDKNKVGSTFVPGRNIIFLAIAGGIADSIGADRVMYGAHADDHSGYPDCTTIFAEKMCEALAEGTENNVFIDAPFVHMHKEDIVEEGIRLGVPFENTLSCYRGLDPACGTCPTCQLRIEAFKAGGYIDPLEYCVDIDWGNRDA